MWRKLSKGNEEWLKLSQYFIRSLGLGLVRQKIFPNPAYFLHEKTFLKLKWIFFFHLNEINVRKYLTVWVSSGFQVAILQTSSECQLYKAADEKWKFSSKTPWNKKNVQSFGIKIIDIALNALLYKFKKVKYGCGVVEHFWIAQHLMPSCNGGLWWRCWSLDWNIDGLWD